MPKATINLLCAGALALAFAGEAHAQTDGARPAGVDIAVAHQGFENNYGALTAFLTLRNDNPYPVKDIPIACALTAPSGTILGTKKDTVYRIIPAHGSIEVKQLNLGLVPPQTAGVNCHATGWVAADGGEAHSPAAAGDEYLGSCASLVGNLMKVTGERLSAAETRSRVTECATHALVKCEAGQYPEEFCKGLREGF